MKLGLFGINFGPCADPDLQLAVARAAEATGYESIWTGEHVAMPLHDNPVPSPPETPFLDSIVSLTRVAVATTRLRLGTGILVLPHHNPVLLAKALASLDVLSGGRLIAGFAAGYVAAEFAALGVRFDRRGAITDDALHAIHALWTQPAPEYRGRFASFGDIGFEPKPQQRPHPPIIIGGTAAPALQRAARFGDGWYGFALTVEQTTPIVHELARLRAATDRATEPLEISLTTFEPISDDLIARARDAGVHRLIVYPIVRGDRLEATVRDIGERFAMG